MIRALFVNSGILGHASVARLIREAAARDHGLDATHLDLSENLTTGERIVRRAMCFGPRPGSSGAASLLLPRFRHEMHAGVQAARRISRLERIMGHFDVIHFHPQPTAWASLRRMRRTPSVVSIDTTQRLAGGEAPAGLARLDYAPNIARDRKVFRAAAAIVATSRWAADDLLADDPDLAGRTRVLPYPVPLDGFDARWIEARHARATADPAAPVRVLFIGGDFPRKGGPELLEAWRAGGFASRATLTLVTDWPGADADLPPGVTVRRGVRAYTPEWLAAWRDADLFVMPTRGEAFGMVFQEAAAAGLPSIGTAINAIPEIVVRGETGILVRRDDSTALVEAMRALVESPDRRRKMGEAARRRMAEVGSIDRYSRELMGIVREAAGRETDG
ncbi:MAG TPA: glycosyltransferase family 4 protein [Longimicrobium sp.]|nr:glycosyltransferase family 4 protein [Longimicrobium sp.]